MPLATEGGKPGIAITRGEHGAAELRQAASRSRDAAAARRMLALALVLALVLDGVSRAEAARSAGMDRQTLRDWVHRYNAEGLAGLSDRPHGGGPARLLTAEQEARWPSGCAEAPTRRSTA